jgi:hypothetical protein
MYAATSADHTAANAPTTIRYSPSSLRRRVSSLPELAEKELISRTLQSRSSGREPEIPAIAIKFSLRRGAGWNELDPRLPQAETHERARTDKLDVIDRRAAMRLVSTLVG